MYDTRAGKYLIKVATNSVTQPHLIRFSPRTQTKNHLETTVHQHLRYATRLRTTQTENRLETVCKLISNIYQTVLSLRIGEIIQAASQKQGHFTHAP